MREIIAARVKARMEALGLKGHELATKAGIAKPTVDAILRADRDCSISTFESIARGLGMTLRELLETERPAGLSSKALEFAELLGSQPAAIQCGVIELLRGVQK